jgi:threonine dehydrogenase-like Zn-dependent dehydrogenase
LELAIPNKPNNTMSKTTMKAVVFKGKLEVKLEDRPIPKIVDPTDIIIKVKYSALCGR